MMNNCVAQRKISRLLWVLMLVVLGWGVVNWILQGIKAIRFPFELDYGEGIVMEQARLIFSQLAYGPIDHFPAIVFHYPPVFQAMSSIISHLTGFDLLAAGRTISLAATLLTAVLTAYWIRILSVGAADPDCQYFAPTAGGFMLLSCLPIFWWSPLMRVDMLAIAFAFLGVIVGTLALQKDRLIYWASLCFVCSVYTKQTSIAAPAALFLALFWYRPVLAIRGILTCLVSGALVLVFLYSVTDAGFVRHVFLYNINRFDPEGLKLIPLMLAIHMIYFVLAFFLLCKVFPTSLANARRLIESKSAAASETSRQFAIFVLFIYWIASSLMTLTIAKSGANINYLVEWMCVTSVLAGLALSNPDHWTGIKSSVGNKSTKRLIFVFPLAIVFQAMSLQLISHNAYQLAWDRARSAELEILSSRVDATEKPIISDNMVMLVRNNRRVLWESAIFAELATLGKWDEAPFVDRIRRGKFGMFITSGIRGDPQFDKRYNPRVADAIDEAYPIKETIAGYTLHLPRAK